MSNTNIAKRQPARIPFGPRNMSRNANPRRGLAGGCVCPTCGRELSGEWPLSVIWRSVIRAERRSVKGSGTAAYFQGTGCANPKNTEAPDEDRPGLLDVAGSYFLVSSFFTSSFFTSLVSFFAAFFTFFVSFFSVFT